MDDRQGGRPAGAGWLTRTAAARKLGVSVATVRRREGTTLHPITDDKGVRRFDPAEVEVLGRESAQHDPAPTDAPSEIGELAAQVFPLFARGDSFTDVVIATRLAPATIRALHQEWQLGYGSRPSAPIEDDDSDAEDVTAAERARDERALAEWEKRMRAQQREHVRLDRIERRRRR
jgi:hypothetical protein